MLDDKKIKQAIPANVLIISGSRDDQTNLKVYNVGDKGLPVKSGRVGGKLTKAFVSAVSSSSSSSSSMSYQQLLQRMSQSIQQESYSQVPQLSSSRRIQVKHSATDLLTSGGGGKKRALLIGINYTAAGEEGALKYSHKNVERIKSHLLDTRQFSNKNIQVMLDSADGGVSPTKKNIIVAMRRLVKASSESGDSVFVYFCGHAGRSGSGPNQEALIPVDYQTAGHIRQEDLYANLICAMPKNTKLVCLFDLANSGSLVNLPYLYAHDQEKHEKGGYFYENAGFELSAILGLAIFGTAAHGGSSGDCGDCGTCGDCDLDLGECCTIL